MLENGYCADDNNIYNTTFYRREKRIKKMRNTKKGIEHTNRNFCTFFGTFLTEQFIISKRCTKEIHKDKEELKGGTKIWKNFFQ
jgi:hypothetical protein